MLAPSLESDEFSVCDYHLITAVVGMPQLGIEPNLPLPEANAIHLQLFTNPIYFQTAELAAPYHK